jgi:Predicted membrane protein
MSHCPKCGGEVSTEMKFCPKCGASLHVTALPSAKKKRLNGDKDSNVLTILSLGVILIVLAITYMLFPLDFSIVITYFKAMANQGVPCNLHNRVYPES